MEKNTWLELNHVKYLFLFLLAEVPSCLKTKTEIVWLSIDLYSQINGAYGISISFYLCTVTFPFSSPFLQICGTLILALAIWVRVSKDGKEVNTDTRHNSISVMKSNGNTNDKKWMFCTIFLKCLIICDVLWVYSLSHENCLLCALHGTVLLESWEGVLLLQKHLFSWRKSFIGKESYHSKVPKMLRVSQSNWPGQSLGQG